MRLVKLLFFQDSKTVGYGLLLHVTATVLLVRHLVTADQWFLSITLAAGLVGGNKLSEHFSSAKEAPGVVDVPR